MARFINLPDIDIQLNLFEKKNVSYCVCQKPVLLKCQIS